MATPQIVCGFPTIHILGQQGEPGQQRDSFKEWEQTSKNLPAAKHQDFAIPIFSHGVNSRDICRTVEGERGGRAPKSCATSGINQCVHCLGCPCPSALPSGCYFYITHIFFFVWTGCFHEETSQKMALMPQCAAADGAVLRVALDRNKGAPLGRGSEAGAAAGLNMPTLCL